MTEDKRTLDRWPARSRRAKRTNQLADFGDFLPPFGLSMREFTQQCADVCCWIIVVF